MPGQSSVMIRLPLIRERKNKREKQREEKEEDEEETGGVERKKINRKRERDTHTLTDNSQEEST